MINKKGIILSKIYYKMKKFCKNEENIIDEV